MVRYLPLVAGFIVGFGLILNRTFTDELFPSQSRSDALGIFGGAMLILVFLLEQQVKAKPPESVVLHGSDRFFLLPELPEFLKAELAWISHTLLTLTVTRSVVIWYNDRVLHLRGILPEKTMTTAGKLTQSVMTKQKPLYLVQLNLYPGKIEFDYLPDNTQSLILQPLGTKGVLILGTDIPRSYTNQDEAWIAALADKLTFSLSSLE
ncbi:MAG: cofactor assembly of complex C subunit B [Cyanobacteria bacterium M5B4]|nr:MAG: cofactor assembly of complex C subunit B [Cyanobacteria bacterium M5B4]